MQENKKHKYSIDIDFANLIVGILIGIISTLIGYLSIQSQENIAEKSGAFDQPNPVAFIGDYQLKNTSNDLIYGSHLNDRTQIISTIPLVIKNKGRDSVEDMTVTFRYPLAGKLAVSKEYLKFGAYGRITNRKPSREYNKVGNFEYVSYTVPNLNPGEIFTLTEPIALSETIIRDTVNVPEIYKGPITDVMYSIKTTVSVSAKNVQVKDYTVEIQSLPSSSVALFKKQVTSLLVQEAENKIKSMSLVERINATFGSPKVSATAIYVSPDSLFNQDELIEVQANSYRNIYYPEVYPSVW